MDVSDRRVAVVHLKSSVKGPRLSAHAVWPLDPAQPFRQQMDFVAAELRAFLSEHHITGTGLFVGIPQEKTLFKDITLPLAARENLSETIRYELDRYLPIPEEDVYVDYQITGEDREAGKLNVLLAAAKKADLSAYIELASGVGIGISGIEPAAGSIISALRSMDSILPEAAFVLAICEDAGVRLISGRKGSLLAARTLQVPPASNGLPESIRAGVQSLTRSRSHSDGDPKPICGGPALDDRLFSDLRKNGAPLDWERLDPESLPVPSWDLLGAFGLASRAFGESSAHFNLLPQAMRRRPSRAGRYLLILLTILTLLTGLGWAGSRILQQRLIQQRLDAQIQEVGEQVLAVEELQSEIDVLQNRAAFLEALKQEGAPALDIIRDLSEIIPETAWIREFSISGNQVRLDGYADSASGLIPLLDASPRMTDVTFLSAITRGRDGKEKFRIGLTIVSPRQ
ncbi:MAG: PilN domain-containing protein [Desulfobacterales bacterium]